MGFSVQPTCLSLSRTWYCQYHNTALPTQNFYPDGTGLQLTLHIPVQLVLHGGPAIHFWFSVSSFLLFGNKEMSGSTSWWPASSHTCWHMMHIRAKCLPGHTPLRQVAETFSSLRRPDVSGSVAITARSLRVGSTRSQSKLNFTHFPVHRVIQCHHSTIKNRNSPGKYNKPDLEIHTK